MCFFAMGTSYEWKKISSYAYKWDLGISFGILFTISDKQPCHFYLGPPGDQFSGGPHRLSFLPRLFYTVRPNRSPVWASGPNHDIVPSFFAEGFRETTPCLGQERF